MKAKMLHHIEYQTIMVAPRRSGERPFSRLCIEKHLAYCARESNTCYNVAQRVSFSRQWRI